MEEKKNYRSRKSLKVLKKKSLVRKGYDLKEVYENDDLEYLLNPFEKIKQEPKKDYKLNSFIDELVQT